MFNRYQVKNTGKQDYQEIMTYPTVSGDLKMKNKHVGVNYDDRDMPQKVLPKEKIGEGSSTNAANLQGVVLNLQNKAIRYNKKYYSQVERKDPRAIDDDYLEDPRSLNDIEQENVDLKE